MSSIFNFRCSNFREFIRPKRKLLGLEDVSYAGQSPAYTPAKIWPKKRRTFRQRLRIVYYGSHAEALDLFGNKTDVAQWMVTKNLTLGDQTPLKLLDTTVGFEIVFHELKRIQYGIAG